MGNHSAGGSRRGEDKRWGNVSPHLQESKTSSLTTSAQIIFLQSQNYILATELLHELFKVTFLKTGDIIKFSLYA